MSGRVDPEKYALLAGALAGRRIGRRRASELAVALRAPSSTRYGDLIGAADVLDRQAATQHR